MKTYYTRVTYKNGKTVSFARLTLRDFPTQTSLQYFKTVQALHKFNLGEVKCIEVSLKPIGDFNLDIYKHCVIVRANNAWELRGLVHCGSV